MNPPSAYAVAKRDAAQGRRAVWTFHSPKGPQGPVRPVATIISGGSGTSRQNKSAAKSLLAYLSTRADPGKAGDRERRLRYPALREWMDFKIWEEEGPPKGTNYNYPPRGDVIARASRAIRRPEDRDPDVRPGDFDANDRPVHATGQSIDDGDELRRKRDRRLYAIVAEPAPYPSYGAGKWCRGRPIPSVQISIQKLGCPLVGVSRG